MVFSSLVFLCVFFPLQMLVYYLAILTVLLFWAACSTWTGGGAAPSIWSFHTIRNYLRYYRNTGSHVSILNLLGNVVIMVPLGMLVPLLFRPMRRFWLSLPLFALVSVGVEYIQWLTATGPPMWTTPF